MAKKRRKMSRGRRADTLIACGTYLSAFRDVKLPVWCYSTPAMSEILWALGWMVEENPEIDEDIFMEIDIRASMAFSEAGWGMGFEIVDAEPGEEERLSKRP